jgi:hypothetical protein
MSSAQVHREPNKNLVPRKGYFYLIEYQLPGGREAKTGRMAG